MQEIKNKNPYLIDLVAGADIKKGQALKWGNWKKNNFKVYPIIKKERNKKRSLKNKKLCKKSTLSE